MGSRGGERERGREGRGKEERREGREGRGVKGRREGGREGEERLRRSPSNVS